MANYPFFYPTSSDKMSDVKKNITNNFKLIEPRNDITVIAAGAPLPQAGNYEIGDRVFRNDPAGNGTWPSNYLLVTKDANWGWHWRPIQQNISPWIDIPSTAIEDTTNWELHPTNKFQIALDSRGWCHWRGMLRTKTPGITPASSLIVLKAIPTGIRPGLNFMHTVSVSPIVSAAGKAGNVAGRIYINNEGYSSFRFFNTGNGVSQNACLDGLHYQNSSHWFYGA